MLQEHTKLWLSDYVNTYCEKDRGTTGEISDTYFFIFIWHCVIAFSVFGEEPLPCSVFSDVAFNLSAVHLLFSKILEILAFT